MPIRHRHHTVVLLKHHECERWRDNICDIHCVCGYTATDVTVRAFTAGAGGATADISTDSLNILTHQHYTVTGDHDCWPATDMLCWMACALSLSIATVVTRDHRGVVLLHLYIVTSSRLRYDGALLSCGWLELLLWWLCGVIYIEHTTSVAICMYTSYGIRHIHHVIVTSSRLCNSDTHTVVHTPFRYLRLILRPTQHTQRSYTSTQPYTTSDTLIPYHDNSDHVVVLTYWRTDIEGCWTD